MLIEEHISVCEDPQVELFIARGIAPAERPLLIIHGGPDWDHTYLLEPLVNLAQTHLLVFADLRGCGRSTVALPQHEYNADAVVSDLISLLDKLDLPRVDLLGFSTGGLFAQRLALAAPDRIRRLIIASSSIPPVPDDAYDDWPEVAKLQEVGRQLWAGNPEPTSELTRADGIAGIPANVWRPDAREEYRRRLDAVHFTAEWSKPWVAGNFPPIRPEDSLERLAALAIPILLLHGQQDMTFPAALAERTAAEMPNTRAVILDQAGHMAHIDQPEAWIEAIKEFLG